MAAASAKAEASRELPSHGYLETYVRLLMLTPNSFFSREFVDALRPNAQSSEARRVMLFDLVTHRLFWLMRRFTAEKGVPKGSDQAALMLINTASTLATTRNGQVCSAAVGLILQFASTATTISELDHIRNALTVLLKPLITPQQTSAGAVTQRPRKEVDPSAFEGVPYVVARALLVAVARLEALFPHGCAEADDLDARSVRARELAAKVEGQPAAPRRPRRRPRCEPGGGGGGGGERGGDGGDEGKAAARAANEAAAAPAVAAFLAPDLQAKQEERAFGKLVQSYQEAVGAGRPSLRPLRRRRGQARPPPREAAELRAAPAADAAAGARRPCPHLHVLLRGARGGGGGGRIPRRAARRRRATRRTAARSARARCCVSRCSVSSVSIVRRGKHYVQIELLTLALSDRLADAPAAALAALRFLLCASPFMQKQRAPSPPPSPSLATSRTTPPTPTATPTRPITRAR